VVENNIGRGWKGKQYWKGLEGKAILEGVGRESNIGRGWKGKQYWRGLEGVAEGWAIKPWEWQESYWSEAGKPYSEQISTIQNKAILCSLIKGIRSIQLLGLDI